MAIIRCPSCGCELAESHGTDKSGADVHTFQCHFMPCLESYDASELNLTPTETS